MATAVYSTERVIEICEKALAYKEKEIEDLCWRYLPVEYYKYRGVPKFLLSEEKREFIKKYKDRYFTYLTRKEKIDALDLLLKGKRDWYKLDKEFGDLIEEKNHIFLIQQLCKGTKNLTVELNHEDMRVLLGGLDFK